MANLTGFAGAFPHGTSDVGTTPFPIQLGTRARDSAGNEYVYCDFTGTVYTGTPVQISTDFTAAKIGTTGRGAFGVATCAATSDNAGWVQIYGRCYMQILGEASGVSPSDSMPTTLSTSAQTLFWLPTTASSSGGEGLRWTSGWGTSPSQTEGYLVQGISVATDASIPSGAGPILPNLVGTTLTSPSNFTTWQTSHSGHDVAVFLNYPKIVWWAKHA